MIEPDYPQYRLEQAIDYLMQIEELPEFKIDRKTLKNIRKNLILISFCLDAIIKKANKRLANKRPRRRTKHD